MVLHGEHKAIADRIKITAYNAEEWLLERLERHYSNPNDVRDLLRTFAELPGDIRSDDTGITVTLDPPIPRFIAERCTDLSPISTLLVRPIRAPTYR
jgi:hypothetical protein